MRNSFRGDLVKQLRRPSDFYRGQLAEDYDGIGQYILVSMSRGSTSAALRARIAAGDFGGSRVFPVGTPVVMHSHHGQLEVLSLGNLGICIPGPFDDFERTIVSGWDTPSSGGVPWNTSGSSAILSVNGSQGLVQASTFESLDAIIQDTSAPSLPWSNAFTMSQTWLFGTALGVNKWIQPLWDVITNTSNEGIEVGFYLTSISGDDPLLFVSGPGGTTNFILTSQPAANVPIYLKWDFTPSGLNQAKLWWDPDPEPDWMVSRTDVNINNETKRLVLGGSQNLLSNQMYELLDFDYVGKSC